MALNKKFFPKVAAADALVPSENFNTVLYTGNGGTQRIGGYINRGAVFNGSSSYIDNTNTSLWSGNITISAWFRTSNNSQRNPIVTIGRGSWVDGFELQVPSANTVGFSFAEGTKYGYFNSSVDLDDGNWHHYVQVSNSTTAKFYIDGVEQTGITTGSGNSRQGSGIRIGRFFQTPEQWAKGSIDQIRIFNKELSSSEVTTLYGETHASTTISTTDIFSDNSGVALYQLDGNANDTGGVSGKFGSAAHFNGSSSQIDLNYASLGMGVNNFSYSFWFKLNSTSGVQTFFQVLSEHINYGLRINDTYNLQSSPTNSSGGAEYIGSNVTLDTNWHHVAYVKSSTNGHSLWYDGTKVAEDTNFTGNVQATTTNKTTLGSATNDINWLNGFLDDVRFYNDELTSTEIGYIYNNTTASIPTDNLVAYYKFDGDARDEQQLYDGVATNVTYAYDGTATNVTYQEATNFQPDLVWIKPRSYADNHNLFDSIRGATKQLISNNTSAESTQLNTLTSFDSNGFTTGPDNNTNVNGSTYVAWCFKGGGTAVSVSNGTNTSSITQSANTDAGFSITKFSGTSTATGNFPHGLSSAPEMVIVKTTSNADSWFVWHKDLTSAAYAVRLNTTDAESSNNAFWNSTAPDATNVTLGGGILVSGWDYVSYCFHSVDGYSKIGSYTGATPSQPVVETGFQPAFVMIKRTDTAGYDWNIYDNERDSVNPNEAFLEANTSDAEATGRGVNFLSNGFQLYGTSASINASGGTFIYLAIAADPDTTTPTVENSFDVVTYTGNGSSQDIETDFKPDLVWVKNRTGTAYDHKIADSVRGATKIIESSTTDAEITATGSINAFNTNGFTIGTDNSVNGNGNNFVAWCWKAGDHDDNLPQINTEGSIDSVVSVNAEAGFSIVKYTGNGTAGSTIGHGLSSTPQMIIIKNLDGTANWAVYTETTGTNATLLLNSTSASTSVSNKYAGTNSTVFGVNSASDVNTSGNEYIAYCFHSVSGYQKIGSYSGNGTDLSITGLGFQPRFLMLKRTDSTGNWVVFDNVRGEDEELYPNLSNAESNEPNRTSLDSDGFTVRSGRYNNSGSTFIYLAIK